MAKSRYEYVKSFEQNLSILKNCWFVIRIDGHSFSKFTNKNSYVKPNDIRGLNLMNSCAVRVMNEFQDIILAYGQSDEYSFVFHKDTTLYGRRSEKISSNLVSLFTANFVLEWDRYFDTKLQSLPCFDSRCVLYPSIQNIRDYCSWRQVDCHINNLYNTCYWKLRESGKTEGECEAILRDTNSGGKNELLFQMGINYNNIEQVYRKGSVLVREKVLLTETTGKGSVVERNRSQVVVKHEDIIKDDFWIQNQLPYQ